MLHLLGWHVCFIKSSHETKPDGFLPFDKWREIQHENQLGRPARAIVIGMMQHVVVHWEHAMRFGTSSQVLVHGSDVTIL